jgi:uncharacterized membrane protein
MIFIAKILVVIFSLTGFLLANHIRKTKREEKPLVCPLNGSCETVVHSSYSKLFGIPLEYLGITYYAVIALIYVSFIFLPHLLPLSVAYISLGLTTAAFFFSLYLTLIQSIILKHWCTWCLMSAGLCTLIFSLVMFISDIKIGGLTEMILP